MTNPEGGSVSGGLGDYSGAGAAVGMLLGPAVEVWDSEQDRKAAEANTDKTIAHQKAESELAYQRAVQMWKLQNAYNTPQMQMERFKAAGLNPHLIYGRGNAGNAENIPQYQPAQGQYRYQATHIAPALNSILPLLMQVGSWMQNMRLTEAEIGQKEAATDKTEQLIEYLVQANPKLLRAYDQKYDLGQYQHEIQFYQGQKASRVVQDMDAKFRANYGDDLFQYYRGYDGDKRVDTPLGGLSRIEFMRKEAEMRLKQAQASYTDFDITNPQALMQLVLSGVMGLAGQQMRLSTHRSSSGMATPKRVKTFYDKGKRRSQVVDY